MNSDLRLKIADIGQRSGEGHISSSFPIVDIVDYLYAEVVEFLCSDASKFVSGTSIVVDGAASVLEQVNLSLRIAQE